MVQRNSPEVDVIMDVLKQAIEAYPSSEFVKSLFIQYQERGSLSRKQLEGLHSKASKIKSISPGRLATLQAIIIRKPTKYRSSVSIPKPEEADLISLKRVEDILLKFPQHKRVLFFKMKLDKKEQLSPVEKAELEKFHKLIL